MELDQDPCNQNQDAGQSCVGDDFDAAESDVLLSESPFEFNVDRVIESINASRIEFEYIPGHSFTAIFHGASLLSFNKLLHLDQRGGELKRYRAACLDAAERAVVMVEQYFDCHRTALPDGLSVSLYRSGEEELDNEDFVASCKLLIDGFRVAGLLKGNAPTQLASFNGLLQRSGPREPASVGITFRVAHGA